MAKIEKKPLNISSDDRVGLNETSDDFTLQFKTMECYGGFVSQLSMPNSFYNVYKDCNTLAIIEETKLASYTVTIANGNYDSTTICSALKTALDAKSVTSGNGLTFTLAVSALTGKVTISATGKFIIDTDNGYNLAWNLGFRNATSTYTQALTQTGETCLDLRTQDVYVKLVGSNISLDSASTVDSTLAVVQMASAFGSVVYYQNTGSDNSFKFPSNTINELHFKITDKWNNPVSLNGLDYSMTIVLYLKSGQT